MGLTIVVWRTAGNTPSLNDDPIPLVRPNDVLCPMLTCVGLRVYAGARGLVGGALLASGVVFLGHDEGLIALGPVVLVVTLARWLRRLRGPGVLQDRRASAVGGRIAGWRRATPLLAGARVETRLLEGGLR